MFGGTEPGQGLWFSFTLGLTNSVAAFTIPNPTAIASEELPLMQFQADVSSS
jgi:hypothetical protein